MTGSATFPRELTAGDSAAAPARAQGAELARILIVEDDDRTRDLIQTLLENEHYRVDTVGSGESALLVLDGDVFDVVLLDLHLTGISGLEVMNQARARELDPQFIIITGDQTVGTAVEAMRLGAFDYITKPIRTEVMLLAVERALEKTRLIREVAHHRRQAQVGSRSGFVGKSPAVQRVFDLIERVAPMSATVLITGPTGTGKELVARAIHDLSPQRARPFVAVQCSALPPSLLESELFGHVKGSFTGAVGNRRGLFEEASGGTLFLDEISTLTPDTQVKILRVLQERQIRRVGHSEAINVNFRLIVATNVDLAAEVAAGRFREDLYYRLNVFPIRVPSLRERPEDIPLLTAHFRRRFGLQNDIEPPAVTEETLARMMEYDWPGNVRELENFVERAMITYAGRDAIRFEPPEEGATAPEQQLLTRAADREWTMDRLEREYILSVLERTKGRRGEAAARLGFSRRTLHRKLKKYALQSGQEDSDLARV